LLAEAERYHASGATVAQVRRGGKVARASQFGFYCITGSFPPDMNYFHGYFYAHGRGNQSCFGADAQVLSGYLWRYDGGWSLLAANSVGGGGARRGRVGRPVTV